jgi:hypothetical protein
MLQVSVGNVVFHGHTTSGFLIGPGGFVGWEGSSATKREAVERQGAHGAFATPAFKTARLVSIAGTALADSEEELEHMEEVLSGIGQSRQQIVVQTSSRRRWAYGSVEGEIKFDRIGGASEADYRFSLFLPDPFKYGETRETLSQGDSVTHGNIAVASHDGNTVAFPRFTVTPTSNIGASGYQIKGEGKTFEVPGPLNVGQVDEVDFNTGTVRRDGALVRDVIPRIFDVGSKESVEWRFWPLSGAGKAVMHLIDTYN